MNLSQHKITKKGTKPNLVISTRLIVPSSPQKKNKIQNELFSCVTLPLDILSPSLHTLDHLFSSLDLYFLVFAYPNFKLIVTLGLGSNCPVPSPYRSCSPFAITPITFDTLTSLNKCRLSVALYNFSSFLSTQIGPVPFPSLPPASKSTLSRTTHAKTLSILFSVHVTTHISWPSFFLS